jgi:hypothetical protein
MDLFNAKALAASESRCAALERELTMTKRDVAIHRRALRVMDDAAFQISQCINPDQMRSYIQTLCFEMEMRRKSESDRIGSIILTELNENSDVL